MDLQKLMAEAWELAAAVPQKLFPAFAIAPKVQAGPVSLEAVAELP
jgi:hypothetical protein